MVYIRKYAPFLFFAFSFFLLLKFFFLSVYPDFLVHYYSPSVLLSGGNPYTFSSEPFLPNVYPPVTIIFFFPPSFFPLFLAGKIWNLISLTSLILSVYLIFKTYKKNIFSHLGLIVLGLVFLSFPVKFTMGMGQINNLILMIIALSIYLLKKKKIIFSAFSLSFALSMKFFPIFFPLYFLLKREWKIFISIIFFFTFLNLSVFIIFPELVNYFYTKVFVNFLYGWKTDYFNQSLTGFLGRNFTDVYLRELTRTVISIFFVIVSFLAIYKTKNIKKLIYFHLSLLITLGLIINNFSWQHHFVFMIIPFLFMLFYLLDKKYYKGLVVLFIAYLLISFNFKDPSRFSPLLTSHVFYGAVLMWVLNIYIILKDFRKPQLNFS